MPVSSNPALTVVLGATLLSPLSTISGNVKLSDTTQASPAVASTTGGVDGAFTLAGVVTAGTPVSIDFQSLTDPFGSAVVAAHVVAIKITNTSGTGNLSYGGGSNPVLAAGPVAISPGSVAAVHDAGGTLIPIASGTRYLQLTSSSGTVGYSVSGLTRSA